MRDFGPVRLPAPASSFKAQDPRAVHVEQAPCARAASRSVTGRPVRLRLVGALEGTSALLRRTRFGDPSKCAVALDRILNGQRRRTPKRSKARRARPITLQIAHTLDRNCSSAVATSGSNKTASRTTNTARRTMFTAMSSWLLQGASNWGVSRATLLKD